MEGKFLCFEGCDGSGKTTAAIKLTEYLQKEGKSSIYVKHPGATPLGSKLRQIVKFDFLTPIDPLSEQLLMLADYSSFVNTLLKIKLNEKNIVVSDRSNLISGMIYSKPAGIDTDTIIKLYDMIDIPKIDKLFIFLCPWEIAKKRINNRGEDCRIESRGEEFMKSINESYYRIDSENSIISRQVHKMSREIIFINASKDPEEVFKMVLSHVRG